MSSSFRKIFVALFLLCSHIVCTSTAASSNLLPAPLDSFKNQFQNALKSLTDISTIHYTLGGMKELGVQPAENLCADIKKNVDSSNIESVYHATEAAKTLNNCQLPVNEFGSIIKTTLQGDKTTLAELFYAVTSSRNLQIPVDEDQVEKRLKTLSKSDDSILGQAYVLMIASQLNTAVAKFYSDSIHDMVQQADEVDGKALQYEGGIGTTAMIFNAMYQLADKAAVPLKIDAQHLSKFAYYFSTKRHVATIRSAYYLIKAYKLLSDPKHAVPVVVSRVSPASITPESPSVLVSITDLMGHPVGEISVVAESAKRKEDGVVVVSKQKLTPKASDFSVYELPFYDTKIPRGFYTIHLTLNHVKSETKLIGLSDNTIEVKVTSEVTIENAEVNLADRDHSAQVKTHKLSYPTTLTDKMDIDYHQKLIVKFQIKDKKTNEYIRAQQCFLRFTNKQSQKEIIYLAEAGTNSQYKVEVDLTTNSNDFRHQSGLYEIVLIIGDALLQNSFSWKIIDANLGFHEDAVSETRHTLSYTPKPEIRHMFRADEKRPPTVVSLIFSGLTLLPLLILLGLWIKLGFNLSGMPFGLSPLGFHVSHAAVFALMFLYWKYLNMFQTVRYLAIVSVPLFLFGHRVLATLAARRSLIIDIPAVKSISNPKSTHREFI
ncbi:unnamed protein product [Didymodactylos carnosus]|uniref:Dolichyl-diphosphooligosaccharide--protein glycosyltransferase subunit 2 n=1 Tax=Didymodactylos carnosus TaxID=1234261 RepID=A0A813QUC8_9BILA|nr:unnamed protein product [Didymodactylos carnosus]CAF0801458.1 unnamed protein product [Didymodactylos carnosus]CAF3555424.1 unnamed protein product [Didymodactylos carnosus]CAF3584820.1 unnamed protein product [Didymodactylos carnosus]